MAIEARLIGAVLAKREAHDRRREEAFRSSTATRWRRSLQVAEIGGPVILPTMATPTRFPMPPPPHSEGVETGKRSVTPVSRWTAEANFPATTPNIGARSGG